MIFHLPLSEKEGTRQSWASSVRECKSNGCGVFFTIIVSCSPHCSSPVMVLLYIFHQIVSPLHSGQKQVVQQDGSDMPKALSIRPRHPERSHIEVLRHSNTDSLCLHYIGDVQGPFATIASSTLDSFTLRFADKKTIKIAEVDSAFDVYVNNKYTYRCRFQDDDEGTITLLHIIKDGARIRIAQAPLSSCTPANEVKLFSARPKKVATLRDRLLRTKGALAMQSALLAAIETKVTTPPPERPLLKKQVRFA